MKKVLLLNFNLLITILIACQPVGQSTGPQMVKPGDEIDGMVITTGTSEAPPLWAFRWKTTEPLVNCKVPPLPKLAIGHTFGLADQALQTLDWSALTWELYLDGHPLNLESFGIHNYVMPDLAPHPSPIREVFRQMRAWDVVLANPTPGAQTLHGMAVQELTRTHGL